MATPQTSQFVHHFEDEALIEIPEAALFGFLDKHSQLAAHMTRRSWMMGGGRMDISADAGGFQRLGSRLRLAGRAFGLKIMLEEEVTAYQPPLKKTWQTIGSPKLLIIGEYRMGFTLTPTAGGCRLRVFIDYEMPHGAITRLLGYLLGRVYARWCVRSMIREARVHALMTPA
jgi:hypothetical protein